MLRVGVGEDVLLEEGQLHGVLGGTLVPCCQGPRLAPELRGLALHVVLDHRPFVPIWTR